MSIVIPLSPNSLSPEQLLRKEEKKALLRREEASVALAHRLSLQKKEGYEGSWFSLDRIDTLLKVVSVGVALLVLVFPIGLTYLPAWASWGVAMPSATLVMLLQGVAHYFLRKRRAHRDAELLQERMSDASPWRPSRLPLLSPTLSPEQREAACEVKRSTDALSLWDTEATRRLFARTLSGFASNWDKERRRSRLAHTHLSERLEACGEKFFACSTLEAARAAAPQTLSLVQWYMKLYKRELPERRYATPRGEDGVLSLPLSGRDPLSLSPALRKAKILSSGLLLCDPENKALFASVLDIRLLGEGMEELTQVMAAVGKGEEGPWQGKQARWSSLLRKCFSQLPEATRLSLSSSYEEKALLRALAPELVKEGVTPMDAASLWQGVQQRWASCEEKRDPCIPSSQAAEIIKNRQELEKSLLGGVAKKELEERLPKRGKESLLHFWERAHPVHYVLAELKRVYQDLEVRNKLLKDLLDGDERKLLPQRVRAYMEKQLEHAPQSTLNSWLEEVNTVCPEELYAWMTRELSCGAAFTSASIPLQLLYRRQEGLQARCADMAAMDPTQEEVVARRGERLAAAYAARHNPPLKARFKALFCAEKRGTASLYEALPYREFERMVQRGRVLDGVRRTKRGEIASQLLLFVALVITTVVLRLFGQHPAIVFGVYSGYVGVQILSFLFNHWLSHRPPVRPLLPIERPLQEWHFLPASSEMGRLSTTRKSLEEKPGYTKSDLLFGIAPTYHRIGQGKKPFSFSPFGGHKKAAT